VLEHLAPKEATKLRGKQVTAQFFSWIFCKIDAAVACY
jgi:hypothetical protein